MIDGLLLKNYVLHYGVPTSTKVIIGWIREMLRGIAYLHQQGYIHRYITGDSISYDSIAGKAMLDSLYYICEEKQEYKTLFVPLQYQAPEIKGGKYASIADIYSMGIGITEILTQKPIYEGTKDKNKLKELINKREYPPEVDLITDPDIKELLKEVLQKNPKTRPSAMELLAKPIFKSLVEKEELPLTPSKTEETKTEEVKYTATTVQFKFKFIDIKNEQMGSKILTHEVIPNVNPEIIAADLMQKIGAEIAFEKLMRIVNGSISGKDVPLVFCNALPEGCADVKGYKAEIAEKAAKFKELLNQPIVSSLAILQNSIRSDPTEQMLVKIIGQLKSIKQAMEPAK